MPGSTSLVAPGKALPVVVLLVAAQEEVPSVEEAELLVPVAALEAS